MEKDTPHPSAKQKHDDLIPRQEIDDIHGGSVAYAADQRPKLLITPSVATVLQAGISELEGRLLNAEHQWESVQNHLERSEKVLRVYIKFLENVSKGKQDAGYIREAVTHLLGIMY